MCEVDVDESGAYVSHQVSDDAFVCLACGAPAIDLRQVPLAMAEEAREAQAPLPREVLCPACETLVSVFPGDDCPYCDSPLSWPAPEADE